MSIIVGNGMLITYCETEVTCPVCSFEFDSSEKADKAKNPIFKMKCPACKSLLGISLPIMGGNTKCFEWNAPKGHALETVTPNKVNGVVPEKPQEDDEYE